MWAGQHLKRTGWVRHSVAEPERVAGGRAPPLAPPKWWVTHRRSATHPAGHMYRMGVIAMLFSDSSLNKERMVKLALVHDMAGTAAPPVWLPFPGLTTTLLHRMYVGRCHSLP